MDEVVMNNLKNEEIKPCFAIKRGNRYVALSFNRSTVEALRHGNDETVVEGFFSESRSPTSTENNQKQEIDYYKLEAICSTYLETITPSEESPYLMLEFNCYERMLQEIVSTFTPRALSVENIISTIQRTKIKANQEHGTSFRLEKIDTDIAQAIHDELKKGGE
jgi:hypothetical protein